MAGVIGNALSNQEGRPASEYRELAPPPSLVTHLLCTWTASISDGSRDYLHRVLPDGCVDIVWVNDTAPVVAGPATHACIVCHPPRSIVVGARCGPGLAADLLGLPATALLNQEVPLQDVCARLAEPLASPVAEQRSVTAKLAGVPFLLPSAFAYPRAPWWDTTAHPPSAVTFSAPIAALLHKHRIAHPWLERATDYCWRQVLAFDVTESEGMAGEMPKIRRSYQARAVLAFLAHVPDRRRAEEAFARIRRLVLERKLVEPDLNAPGEVHTPLDYAPAPP